MPIAAGLHVELPVPMAKLVGLAGALQRAILQTRTALEFDLGMERLSALLSAIHGTTLLFAAKTLKQGSRAGDGRLLVRERAPRSLSMCPYEEQCALYRRSCLCCLLHNWQNRLL